MGFFPFVISAQLWEAIIDDLQYAKSRCLNYVTEVGSKVRSLLLCAVEDDHLDFCNRI